MTPAQLLDFEHRHPRHTPDKTAHIRAHLGISEIRYYQMLLRAARTDDGIRAHPITARIVRERADRRARERRLRTAA